MSRAILGNVGFEFELAGHPHSKPIRAQEARFEAILRLVPGFEEAEIVRGPTSSIDVLAWGYGPRARALAPDASGGWPSLDVVRRVNDKRFAHALAHKLGIALPTSKIAACVAEVFDDLRAPVLVKHPFGVAGRGIIHITNHDSITRKRVHDLLAEIPAVVEPRVEIAEEWSGQYECGADGAVCVGFTGLMALANGQFRGNSTVVTVPESAQRSMQQAADEVWAFGYRGPVGIDGYVGRLGGAPVVVPLSEINARWTFGRLTLELSRWMGFELRWHHPPRAEQVARPAAGEGAGAGEWALPEHSDPGGRSGTYIETIRPLP